jgi:hypothetical protein
MDKLNYDILDTLTKPPNGDNFVLIFEVTNVDVKRLRDDHSEIHAGQEVAFVATASFRITAEGLKRLRDLKSQGDIGSLAVGDELFVIGPDAELRSDKVEIDEDSVALWIAKHYTFKFLLNGEVRDVFRDVGRVRIATASPVGHARDMALPWIVKLNTAAVKDDYIDVDVQINPMPLATGPINTTKLLSTPASSASIDFDQASVHFSIEIDAAHNAYALPSALVKREFRLPLRSEHGDVQLVIRVDCVTAPAQPGQSGHPGKPSNKST